MFDIRTKNLQEACHPDPTEGSATGKDVHGYRNGIRFPGVDRFLDKHEMTNGTVFAFESCQANIKPLRGLGLLNPLSPGLYPVIFIVEAIRVSE